MLVGVSLVLLLLVARAGQRGGQWHGTRLPLALALGAPLETEWVEGESREGFLQVDKVLKDPRTTKDPLTAETYDQQVGVGNRLETKEGNGKGDDRAKDDSLSLIHI